MECNCASIMPKPDEYTHDASGTNPDAGICCAIFMENFRLSPFDYWEITYSISIPEEKKLFSSQ
jgi:hypothetical protein